MSDRVRMAASTFLTEGRFRLALLVMVVLRWLMLLLFLFNVPPLEPRNQWLMWPGADQDRIYFAAYWLLRGRAWRTEAGLGQVLVMALFSSVQKLPLWVHHIRPWTGRHFSWVSYMDIIPEMVMLNAFLLGGLSIVLVGLMGRDVTRRKSIGLTAAALRLPARHRGLVRQWGRGTGIRRAVRPWILHRGNVWGVLRRNTDLRVGQPVQRQFVPMYREGTPASRAIGARNEVHRANPGLQLHLHYS